MLLSHRYNFLFVHIAKTGGTSVRDALDRLRWQDPKYYPMWLCSRLSALFNHELACKLPRHAKAIAAQEMLPRELYQRLFKFAFVRNPWDLQVSSYHHLQRERPQLLTMSPASRSSSASSSIRSGPTSTTSTPRSSCKATTWSTCMVG